VSVARNEINGEKQLLMNAVNEVTTRLVHDQSFKLLGHLGLLLHDDPKTALMICLGAGLSAGATMTHAIDRLDIVDLSSAVQNGARLFAEENHHVLDDPRLHLFIDDGRQFLLNARTSYDVAIIDSTHPKAVDSWILYTKEFYDLVRARLSDGGVVVQWLPLHGLSEREFKIIVRTFLSSFPEMTLWANAGFETYGPVAYAKLVAQKGRALSIDYHELARRLAEPKIHDDLAPFGMETPEEILDLFLAPADVVRAWTDGLPVQTDDHPIVPYTTAFSSGRRMEPPLLLAVRTPIAPFVAGMDANSPERAALDSAYEAQGLVIAGLLDRARAIRPASETIFLFEQRLDSSEQYYRALAER
jgi:spermidine synthase